MGSALRQRLAPSELHHQLGHHPARRRPARSKTARRHIGTRTTTRLTRSFGPLQTKAVLSRSPFSALCANVVKAWRKTMLSLSDGAVSPLTRVYPLAQFNLGQAYRNGKGVAQSDAEAV